jgi:hypothetical protein
MIVEARSFKWQLWWTFRLPLPGVFPMSTANTQSEYGLLLNDAANLDLALSGRLALAALDGDLGRAARKSRVSLFCRRWRGSWDDCIHRA